MSVFFAENPGVISVVPWYADNETVLQEVRFSVPADEWTEFEASNLFRELEAYVESLKTRDKATGSHTGVCTPETGLMQQIQMSHIYRESFWVRVRNKFRHRK